MWKYKPIYVSLLGPVGVSLNIWQAVTCHTSETNSPLPVVGQAQCVIISEVHGVCSIINVSRRCMNLSDAFWYIGSEVRFKSWRWSFILLIKKYYEQYFGYKVCDQDKSWAPHFCFVTCASLLTAWENIQNRCLSPFLWFGESPQTTFQIATSSWPVSLV
jgi:hypothetical protein